MIIAILILAVVFAVFYVIGKRAQARQAKYRIVKGMRRGEMFVFEQEQE